MFKIINEIDYFLYLLHIKYLYPFYNRWKGILIFFGVTLVLHYNLGFYILIAITIYNCSRLFRDVDDDPVVNYVPIDQRTTELFRHRFPLKRPDEIDLAKVTPKSYIINFPSKFIEKATVNFSFEDSLTDSFLRNAKKTLKTYKHMIEFSNFILANLRLVQMNLDDHKHLFNNSMDKNYYRLNEDLKVNIHLRFALHLYLCLCKRDWD
jgi:hypothetical protein